MFLTETKQDFAFVQGFQDHFGFDNIVTVDPIGTSGGLALYYNNDYMVNILYTSNQMIDVEATILGKKTYMTFVYGEPVPKIREHVWERLTRYGLARSEPWFIIGDLNEITVIMKGRWSFKESEIFCTFQQHDLEHWIAGISSTG